MSRKLTEAVFSMQCSFIAKNAAAWAGDILTLPSRYDLESDPKTVARFTDEMRARLDRLDEWAGRGTIDATEILTPEARLEALGLSPSSRVCGDPIYFAYDVCAMLDRQAPAPDWMISELKRICVEKRGDCHHYSLWLREFAHRCLTHFTSLPGASREEALP